MERSSLNIFALTTAVTTFFLLIAGSLVTTTGSGLAVPDWPLSFGQFFPQMKGGVFFEHGHRVIAGIVLILSAILSGWLWKSKGKSKVSILSTLALGLVLIQALLGGITVLYGLPPAISTLHATLAQTFFCLMVSIALFTSPIWKNNGSAQFLFSPRVRKKFFLGLRTYPLISVSVFILLFIQLILGASFRHGLGMRPLYGHIGNGFLVALLGGVLSLYIVKEFRGNKILFRAGLFFLALLLAQMVLGLTAVSPLFGVSLFPANVRIVILTSHIGLGALLLAASLVITLLQYKANE